MKGGKAMRILDISYDKIADAAYIYVDVPGPGKAVKTYCCDPIEIDGMINLDFDAAGRLIGIEVLGASSKLSPDVLRFALLDYLVFRAAPVWALLFAVGAGMAWVGYSFLGIRDFSWLALFVGLTTLAGTAAIVYGFSVLAEPKSRKTRR